ncbi:Metacaspase-1 [Nakaseomyces glabratus]|nr:Caspase domain [Nakaseomyces glabratus]QNG14875.1 YCA1 [Nakaseomyces glabratus]SCV17253.1 Metacaspase-1 [Nakaseomyces glabratus]SLM17049.1 Metacaspase-1 [Nakaseomyces glabratus]
MYPGSGNYSYNNRPPMPPPGFNGDGQGYRQEYGNQYGGGYQQQQYQDQYQGENRGQYQGQYQDQPEYGRPPSGMVRPPSSIQQGNGQQFQYSQMTGRRKALLIGINYIGSKNALRGCINDAHNIFNYLTTYCGYRPEDIVMLTDDQREMVKIPLKENIIRAMQWLVKDAQPNDALFFHYSGHGGQTKDLDGDEEDGMDDVIYPVDFESLGPLIDDTMHDIMVKSLPQGARLTALFDSCHSGTVLDLPYTYSTKGVIKEPNMWKDVGSDGIQAAMAYATGNRSALFSSIGNMVSSVTKKQNVDRERVRQIKFSPADVIMLSGSKDNQTSADTFADGQNIGAMSHAFISVMTRQPQQSYLSLLQNLRNELAGKYSQKPQLSASHPIDVNLQFIM